VAPCRKIVYFIEDNISELISKVDIDPFYPNYS
jgi:hypothetical protein